MKKTKQIKEPANNKPEMECIEPCGVVLLYSIQLSTLFKGK